MRWFGDPNPDEGLPWNKGERLAELVKKQRTLLILDGLEPLQYPPGEMVGSLKDPGLQCLLRELARHNPGLYIITTRLPVDDLKDFVGTSVERINLEHLSPEVGAELLENLGVKGTTDELKQAVDEFDGHALALTLLGRYLAVVYNGDIRQRDKIAQLTKEPRQGGHARRVMESYERWFEGKPEMNILLIMGLFDRPAEGGAIEALRAKPAIKGLTSELQELLYEDWQFALNNLRTARLLAGEEPHRPDTLDCHPLVREHFGEKLKESNSDAWKEAHSRLYEYYKSHAKEYPDTLEEMVPLYDALSHGCQAGRHQEVLDKVYRKRILRENEYFSMNNLGAFGADLAALSGFFDSLWCQPVAGLTEVDKGFVLHQAGFRLWALSRLAEAAQSIKLGIDAYIAVENWKLGAIAASNLRGIYLTSGDLYHALDYAQKSLNLAGRSGDADQQMGRRSALVKVLHQIGRLSDAETVFLEAEVMQEKKNPYYSLPCFWYCDLLLDQGRYQEVQNRAGKALDIALNVSRNLLDIGVYHLALGHANLLQTQKEGTCDFTQAAVDLEQAVDGLRQSGRQDYLPFGLLARAELHLVLGEFKQAQRDLNETMSIAKRRGMRIFEADCHLEYARLYLAMGEKDKARENLATAKEMIEQMGYHRRDNEVRDLEEQLKNTEGGS